MPRLLDNKDFCAGILFAAISATAIFLSSGYNIGTARKMGPAFFPMMVGALLGVFSIVLMIRGIRSSSNPIERLGHWSTVLILGSITIFMFALHPLGLPLAIIIMVLISSYASQRATFLQSCLLAVALAVASTAVFKFALGQSLPACGWLFAEQLCPARWS